MRISSPNHCAVLAIYIATIITMTSCNAKTNADSSGYDAKVNPSETAAMPDSTPNPNAETAHADTQAVPSAPPVVKTIPIEVFEPRTEYLAPNGEDGTTIEQYFDQILGSRLDPLCELEDEEDEDCSLKTPFIMHKDYIAFNLKPGDLFRTTQFQTPSEDKQYQIIDGIAEDAKVFAYASDGATIEPFTGCNIYKKNYGANCMNNQPEKIVRIKIVSDNAAPTNPMPGNTPQATTGMPSIPSLIPAPAVNITPEERLTFKKSLKSKKGKVEYLIFNDNMLNTDCYISMLGNQEVLNELHYCIPFSGITKELEHPLALTKTALEMKHYAYCTNISVEKRNIPGLAGFFGAFNPTYYQTHLKRFIDRPFQVTKPQNTHKKKENCGGRCRPYNVQCVQNFYAQTPSNICNLLAANQQGRLSQGMLDYCKLNNPFITFVQYNQYNLRPGDVFLTSSAKKGEKALHQYWQIFDMTSADFKFNGTPEFIWELNTCRNTLGQYSEQIVQVRDLSNKDTYDVLYTPIMQGMNMRDTYCKAFNNTLINEARAGNYALVDPGSPLLKKK